MLRVADRQHLCNCSVMDIAELGRLADEVYALAGVTVATPLVMLARKLGIPVYSVPGLRVRGWLAEVNGAQTVAIRASLRGPERAFTVAHELGHWALQRFGVRTLDRDQEEQWASALGACLLMPRRAFVGALTELEFDHLRNLCFAELGARFNVTQAAAALRLGETTGTPVAVVTPARVYGRGELQCDETQARLWARTGHPGLARVKLGDSRAVALVGAAA